MERSLQGSGKRRPWLGLSLRMTLLLVAAVGVPLGIWSYQARLQKEVVERVTLAYGTAIYEDEVVHSTLTAEANEKRILNDLRRSGIDLKLSARFVVPAGPATPKPSRLSAWLRRTAGEDFAHNVVQILAVSSKLSDDDLAGIGRLHWLDTLNLGQTGVGDAGIAHLSGLDRLKGLFLFHTKVTDDGLVPLSGLRSLERLGLAHNPQITDRGLAHLRGLRNLRELELVGTSITGDGLAHLEGLDRLEILALGHETTTDEGLAHIRKLRGLRMITVDGRKVSQEALNALLRDSPGLERARP